MRNLFQIDRLQTKSLTKQICDGYRSAIVEGRLKGGDRFPTCREICDEFGVSMIVSSAAGIKSVLEIGFERGYASAVSRLRRAGIRAATLNVKETLDFRHYGHVQRAGLAAAEQLLSEGKSALPDLVYFTDDYLASGALISFARRGVRFPRDVRFVSLSTKGFEPVWWQDVTRIEWDWFKQGKALAKRVVELLEGRTASADSAISPEYITGETFPIEG